MAKAFRLTAKRTLYFKGVGGVAMAKGMSIEHVEQNSSAPDKPHVEETLKHYFGKEVSLPTSVTSAFEIEKL